MEDFKVGEEVEFEVCDCGRPRYNWEDDGVGQEVRFRCSPPKYITGKVSKMRGITPSHSQGSFVVDFGDGNEYSWFWPQPSNNPTLYEREGYLRRTSGNDMSSTNIKNNDGRDVCFACGAKTRSCGGFSFINDYRVCTKCGK